MKTSRLIAALAATLSLAAVGCGGDPIVGTWRSTRISAATSSAIETTFVFNGNGFADITIKTTFDTASTMYPGCVQTLSLNQTGWQSMANGSSRRVMLNGTGLCTLGRASCRNAGDNQDATSCPAGMTGPGAVGGDYNVAMDTLNLTLGSETYVCMRQ